MNGLTLLIWNRFGKALSSPGIRSNKMAHINCSSSARMAGNVGANVDQIRRQGRWNNTTTNGAYLINLPRELGAIYGSPGDPIQTTVAENAFVQVIMMFRKTFIQDSVIMMEPHPCYPICGNIQSSLIQSICHSKGKSTS
ncbi:hypothetical protein [Absidia glauca]|uniref:Ndc10 domain-containing protein n=1 Tax=Absidia glauca TaxID=4829 RepID=A0A163J469_ABSGL|nr:hypothetical protein [Absidia glauca]